MLVVDNEYSVLLCGLFCFSALPLQENWRVLTLAHYRQSQGLEHTPSNRLTYHPVDMSSGAGPWRASLHLSALLPVPRRTSHLSTLSCACSRRCGDWGDFHKWCLIMRCYRWVGWWVVLYLVSEQVMAKGVHRHGHLNQHRDVDQELDEEQPRTGSPVRNEDCGADTEHDHPCQDREHRDQHHQQQQWDLAQYVQDLQHRTPQASVSFPLGDAKHE